MDFVHDQLFDGRKIRVLTIVETVSLLSPAIGVGPSYRDSDVVETLERVIQEIGCSQTIRLGNGITHRQATCIWIRSQPRSRRQGERHNWSIYALALPAKCDLPHTF